MLVLAASLAVAGAAQAEGGSGKGHKAKKGKPAQSCLLYTSPSPRD